MQVELRKVGATSQNVYVFLQDALTGQPATGLTVTNLYWQYTRDGAAPSSRTAASALASAGAAWSSGGMFEVDATGSPGWYRLCVPDAVFAAGVNRALLVITGSTIFPWPVDFHLSSLFSDARLARLALVGKQRTTQSTRTREVYDTDNTTVVATLQGTSAGSGDQILDTPTSVTEL